ncbi:MAG TPA: hypothetical protein VI583_16295 [Cyclobacteriaceae bacterium]|nr:hypothetical protein [Cyclobacteriaceae bacterium]
MKKFNVSIALIPVILAMAGLLNDTRSQDFDYGRIKNNSYQNKYFNFEMKIPSGWVVLTKEQADELTKAGQEMVAGDDEKLQAVMKASEINTANLLAVYQFELGSPVDFNPNFMIVAENIKNAPGIKKGSDYLFQSKRILEQGQFKYDYLSPDFELENINGTEFYKMIAKLNYMGLEIEQVYYSTVLKGFSFNVIISYTSEEQKEILLAALNTMTFR